MPLQTCALPIRSEEHTSELQHTIISYAVFCLKKKKQQQQHGPHGARYVVARRATCATAPAAHAAEPPRRSFPPRPYCQHVFFAFNFFLNVGPPPHLFPLPHHPTPHS